MDFLVYPLSIKFYSINIHLAIYLFRSDFDSLYYKSEKVGVRRRANSFHDVEGIHFSLDLSNFRAFFKHSLNLYEFKKPWLSDHECNFKAKTINNPFIHFRHMRRQLT